MLIFNNLLSSKCLQIINVYELQEVKRNLIAAFSKKQNTGIYLMFSRLIEYKTLFDKLYWYQKYINFWFLNYDYIGILGRCQSLTAILLQLYCPWKLLIFWCAIIDINKISSWCKDIDITFKKFLKIILRIGNWYPMFDIMWLSRCVINMTLNLKIC